MKKFDRTTLLSKLREDIQDSKDLTFSISKIELLQSPDGDEEGKKKKKAKITAMCSGWNQNDTYFSKEIIAQLPPMIMKKPKLYLNHDMFAFLGRGVDEWMATYEECEYVEEKGIGKVVGTIEFTNNPRTVWIYDEIEKDPSNVHFSTHLRGIASEDEEIEGRKGQVVKVLVDYKSTDCVSYGAAGGVALEAISTLLDNPKFVQMLNSQGYKLEKLEDIEDDITNKNNNQNKNKGVDDMEIKTLADLKANVPSEILSSFLNEGVKAELEKQEVSKKVELLASTQEKLVSVEKVVADKDKEVAELKNQISVLEKEKNDVKAKLDEIEAAKTLANWKNEVDQAIKESEIDSRLVTEVFLNTLYGKTKIDEVKQLIEDRKSLTKENLINVGSSVNSSDPTRKTELTDDAIVNGIKGHNN